jgi:hypothetical protein
MSVASRPVSTGKTRTCPHCKATILESLSICPGCMHHLRFDSEAAKRQVAAAPALRVEGIIRHPPLEQPLEYFVIIAIRNDRGEEVTRQVVNVGALQAAEKRTFTLSVEVLPPQAPVPTKSNASTGTFKSPIPQPTATVRPSAPSANPTSAVPTSPAVPTGGSSVGSSTPGAGASAGRASAGGASAAATSTAGTSGPGASAGTSSGATRPPGSSVPQAPPAPGTQPSHGVAPNPSSSPNPPGSNPVRPPGANPVRPPGPNTGRVPGPNTAKPPTTSPNPAGSSGYSNPANPTNPANPASPAKPTSGPTSGYVLKPPSPGGPKRH